MSTTLGLILSDASRSTRAEVRILLDRVASLCQDMNVSAVPLKTQLEALIAWLRDIRMAVPDKLDKFDRDSLFTRLDAIIIPLWNIQRKMDYNGPLELPDHLKTDAFDIYVSDVKPEDLPARISDLLEVQYLAPASHFPVWPLIGKIWGYHRRVMFTIPILARGRSISVHFLFDTGAPATFIAKSTLDALGMEEWQLGAEPVRVNGVIMDLAISDSQKVPQGDKSVDVHFSGINILGMDYLRKIDAELILDMKNMRAMLTKQ